MAKMKTKLTAVILSAALLTACSKAEEPAAENNARIIDSFTNVTDSGMLYSDGDGRLNFFDFESMNSSVLCTRPNCTHTDRETCSSYGMTNHPILYDGSLFFFDREFLEVEKDGEFVLTNKTTIYQADPDGTNRISRQVIDEFTAPFGRMLLSGDTAYFPLSKVEYDEYGSSTGYEETWLCSYNIPENKFTMIEKLYEGYHAGTWIHGLWDGKIYLNIGYAHELIPYPFGMESDNNAMNDYMQKIKDVTISEEKVYDIEAGTVSDSDMPKPEYVGEGYYVYDKDGAAAVVPEIGGEMVLKDFPMYERNTVYIYGDIMFSYRENICADLSKGGKIKALDRSEGEVIEAYYNGGYIVSKYTAADDGEHGFNVYSRVEPDQLIAG